MVVEIRVRIATMPRTSGSNQSTICGSLPLCSFFSSSLPVGNASSAICKSPPSTPVWLSQPLVGHCNGMLHRPEPRRLSPHGAKAPELRQRGDDKSRFRIGDAYAAVTLTADVARPPNNKDGTRRQWSLTHYP